MDKYTIRWSDKKGYNQSEQIACECFDDAARRCKMKAALCEGTPLDVEWFGPIVILETAEQEAAYMNL